MSDMYGDLRRTVRDALQPDKGEKAYLGYTIDSVRVIDVSDDPSRVYVRYPSGAYNRVLHKSRVKTTPVDNFWGMAVRVGKDEEGFDAILGISSSEAPGILTNRGRSAQVGGHVHSIEDITEVGDGTPSAGAVLLGDGDSWESTQLEAALDSVIPATPVVGFLKRTALGTYAIVASTAVLDIDALMNSILTDDNGNILVDDDGNVMTDGSYG